MKSLDCCTKSTGLNYWLFRSIVAREYDNCRTLIPYSQLQRFHFFATVSIKVQPWARGKQACPVNIQACYALLVHAILNTSPGA
jgi:hypothetical protein